MKQDKPSGSVLKRIPIDIMDGNGRFVCTLRFPCCPLFPFTEQEVVDFVVRKLPTLKNKKFTIAF